MKLLAFISIICLAAVITAQMPNISDNNSHACKWEKCPYKGITIDQYRGYIDCEPGSKCYTLDSLHVIYSTVEDSLLEPIVDSIHNL